VDIKDIIVMMEQIYRIPHVVFTSYFPFFFIFFINSFTTKKLSRVKSLNSLVTKAHFIKVGDIGSQTVCCGTIA
jgi:hypothetical protein